MKAGFMKVLQTKAEGLRISAVGLGCMRLMALKDDKDIQNLIHSALKQEINFFDHADIYAGGMSEYVFGRNISGINREDNYYPDQMQHQTGYLL